MNNATASTRPALFSTPTGRPVGAIGFGRFTPEQMVAYRDGALDGAIATAQANMAPALSREDMYAALFG